MEKGIKQIVAEKRVNEHVLWMDWMPREKRNLCSPLAGFA